MATSTRWISREIVFRDRVFEINAPVAGSYTSLFAAYEWRLARNFALAVSYTLGDLSVEIEGSRALSGDFGYVTDGFQLYGRILF